MSTKAKKKKKTAAAKPRFDLAELVARCHAAREAGKRGYQRADRLLTEIAAAVKPGETIRLNSAGRSAVLHDRFAEAGPKAVIWTPCAARRYELEIIEP
jgi:hypothetical protein